MVKVKIKMEKGCEDLTPKKAHDTDSGFDIKSKEDVVVFSGKCRLIKTGVFMELPKGYEAQVRSRSGLAYKNAVFVLNSPGTIDADYRGEVGVILFNNKQTGFEIKRGDRIAQIVINRLPKVDLEVVEKLNKTERGEGGFGSTGVK